jgi:RNA polymerase sigma-70 factor (ECF subfamily)
LRKRNIACVPASAGFYFERRSAWGMTSIVDQMSGLKSAKPDSDALAASLRAIAAGRREAMKPLYERTSAKLYGICLRLLGDAGEAQDVLQDVYATVWRSANRFDPAKAGAITWLAVLTRNKAIDRLRRRRAPTAELDSAEHVPDDSPSALDVLEKSEDAARLSNCLDALDERARNVIRSAFFDGASYPTLAERQGVPLPTMKSWIRRGLTRLRGCLEQ